MISRRLTKSLQNAALFLAAFFVLSLIPSTILAQNTQGGTDITNTATGAYEDGDGTSYNTASNTITITVANVSGLAITPDGTSIASVVPGQTNVTFPFVVTNTSNYAAKIHFQANGASVRATNGTITAAFVDYNGNNSFDEGTDLNIFSNGTEVDTSSIAKDASVNVIVKVTVSSSLSAGQTVSIILGDAGSSFPFDEQNSDDSAHEVRTNSEGISPAPLNDESEARGLLSATVDADASLKVALSASSAGPLNYSTDITYTTSLNNIGARAASAVTLSGNSGVYIVVTIPGNTKLKAGQTWPAGTLFSATETTTPALSATYSSTQPAASTVTRVAFKVGDSLAASTTSASFTYVATIDAGPFNATDPIKAYADAYALNYVGASLTDRSGDDVAASLGAPVETTVTQTGGVLIGTATHADASLTTTNNDYTNRSVNTGIEGVAFGGVTTAEGEVTFTNTLKNTGNANDTFTITAPTVPDDFTVEVSTDGGTNFTDISDGVASVSLAITYDSTADVLVRITAPAGKPVLTGFDTVLRAKSGITASSTNETIDRLYTGFIRLNKSSAIENDTEKGDSTDAVPGAVITYSVQYTNIATTGGTHCVTLNAYNLVITENGSAGANNWSTHTSHVPGSAVDTKSGVITGDVAASNLLTVTIAELLAGDSGTFYFQRVIK